MNEEIIIIYDGSDTKVRVGLLEFLENSESCKLARIDGSTLGFIYLAAICFEGDRVVGLCGLLKNKYVNSDLVLSVREGSQERGIATKLQTTLLNEAFYRRIPIALTTDDTDVYRHVTHFYKKFGFHLFGQYKERLLYVHEKNSYGFNVRRKLIFYYLAFAKDCRSHLRNLRK